MNRERIAELAPRVAALVAVGRSEREVRATEALTRVEFRACLQLMADAFVEQMRWPSRRDAERRRRQGMFRRFGWNELCRVWSDVLPGEVCDGHDRLELRAILLATTDEEAAAIMEDWATPLETAKELRRRAERLAPAAERLRRWRVRHRKRRVAPWDTEDGVGRYATHSVARSDEC